MRAAPVALALLLAGCTGAAVDDSARVHIVQPGETLFGIAWTYGLDYRDLARWNRLPDPDFIQVGQRLRLTPLPGAAARTAAGSPAGGGRRAAAPPARPARSAPPVPTSPPPEWQWPTAGPVVSAFQSSSGGLPSGISIAGRVGQAIEAAAGGRVVYAGSGLIGYGQLVIIRHNDTYLTAYGHNSRLLVEQGQTVVRGQKIAEMGLGPERQPRLHFEIRLHGAPVDPLKYLPPKR
ncbi:MAG TPA: peptidoglycan DD-metalloendopeptidase family protein [Gammaproteobacteria bacterium]